MVVAAIAEGLETHFSVPDKRKLVWDQTTNGIARLAVVTNLPR